ncbi:nucleoside deaminase [Peptoniphilus asaccharolyticus]
MIFLKEALNLAAKSIEFGDVPIGAVVIKDNQIVGRGYNQKEKTLDASAHAEMLALKDAAKTLGTYHLEDCIMYSTLEPCCMCAGAIINFRIKKLYIGTRNQRFGCCGSNINLLTGLNHTTEVEFLDDPMCSEIISDFFKTIRKENNK